MVILKHVILTLENGNFIVSLMEAGHKPLGEELFKEIFITKPISTFNKISDLKYYKESIYLDEVTI